MKANNLLIGFILFNYSYSLITLLQTTTLSSRSSHSSVTCLFKKMGRGVSSWHLPLLFISMPKQPGNHLVCTIIISSKNKNIGYDYTYTHQPIMFAILVYRDSY